MKKNVWEILFISFIVLLGVSFTTFVILTTINCINTYNDEFTSFPWYTPLIFNSIYFSIPLLIEIGLVIFFGIKYKKSKK